MHGTRGRSAPGPVTRLIGDGERMSDPRGGGLQLGVLSQLERASFGHPPSTVSPQTRVTLIHIIATYVLPAISRVPVFARAQLVA